MTVLTIKAVNKDINSKKKVDNDVHNNLRLFDSWVNLSFTTSETNRDC